MADFMIRFLICNLFISGIIGIIGILKRLFQNTLSSRMQYNLWFVLLGLLAVPFVPLRPVSFSQILSWIEKAFSWFERIGNPPALNPNVIDKVSGPNSYSASNWMNDFTISVSSKMPPITGFVLLGIWIIGILAMIILIIKSALRLRNLRKSALSLQSPEVHKLYQQCLNEMHITQDIPIYSTAFLISPIIVGVIKPCIYLPIHLISDYHATDMRYMLLHELQHYKHKDAIGSFLMNLIGVIYWFNPFVWYALKEMHNDREVACDTSVLQMLTEDEYETYGNTLINFAEKISLSPFPFATGISGSMKQMKKRIRNIASYKKSTLGKRVKGGISFGIVTALLLCLIPSLSTYAANESLYQWESSSENISYIDLSTYFGEYEGSFVLYDLENDAWSIHDMEHAILRVAPNSTYKIYDALFGLEEGIITPNDSFIAWNGEKYPFEEWNTDQTLQSAMQSSVNWYFQAVDEQLGATNVYSYIQVIGYGNENISGDFSSYWLESSLKISTVEQVELLMQLYHNSFGFNSENINTVKDSIQLFTSEAGAFYGKTGTGRVDGKDVNGWFVGFVETADNTYFFATNIAADEGATGGNATEITMSILSGMDIWN